MTPAPRRPDPPDRLRFEEEEGMGTEPEGGFTLDGFLWTVFTLAVALLLAAPWIAVGEKISVAGAMTINAITLLIALIVISVARED